MYGRAGSRFGGILVRDQRLALGGGPKLVTRFKPL